MKKLIRAAALILVFSALFSVTAAAGEEQEPELTATAAVALDFETGEVLFEKNTYEPKPPASMTKLMTAYIVFQEIEAGRLCYDQKVPVSEYAASVCHDWQLSNVPFSKGETPTVDSLLKAALLPSGCGACVVLAEAVSGTEEEFVKRMNDTASEMGIESDFHDSYGMSENRLSAYDMAVISRNIINDYPVVLEYTSLQSAVIRGKTYENTNSLVGVCPGVDGLKTGTTDAAGRCLAVTVNWEMAAEFESAIEKGKARR